jgi:hypothetical protein
MSKRPNDFDEDLPAGKVAKSLADGSADSANEIYTSVLLRTDGSIEEVRTSLADANKMLGDGEFQFLGGWAENNTIMLVNADQTNEDLDLNGNKLQPPFHKHAIRGNILVIKTDDNGNRADFGLSEYKFFQSLEIEEWELGDDDDDEGGNDDQEDSGEAALYDGIISSVTEDCVSKISRDLTEGESELIIHLIGNIGEILRNFNSDDENADLDKIIGEITGEMKTWFSQTFSRPPSEEEDTIISITVNRVVISATEDNGDAELVNNIYEQLVDNFRQENSRSPTVEEIQDIRQQSEQLVNGEFEDDDDDEEDDGQGEEDEDAEDNDDN